MEPRPSSAGSTGQAAPGLCASCRHAHRIAAVRSTFWRCRLSEADPRFPRYPALPVVRCAGHDPMEQSLHVERPEQP